MINAVSILAKDNVIVAIENIIAKENICYREGENIVKLIAKEDIVIYHKIAKENIKKGEYIIKYGEHIGIARCNIEKGEHIHCHNVIEVRENLKISDK